MIGFFDSGFGGLTILKRVVDLLPEYDYIYLGDNARVPYGVRSHEIVYEFTIQAVEFLFKKGCPLIIIACNTASAKALRRIQQEYLQRKYPDRRVLGVIRPSAEEIIEARCRKVGILATEGVVSSGTYITEIKSLDSAIKVYQQACPLLVPIIEAGEQDWPGTDMIISKYLNELFTQDNEIDTILLACTHYPILYEKFKKLVPHNVLVLEQGPVVAKKIKSYLLRHPEMEHRFAKKGGRIFLTTDTSERFDRLACIFYGERIYSELVPLEDLCYF